MLSPLHIFAGLAVWIRLAHIFNCGSHFGWRGSVLLLSLLLLLLGVVLRSFRLLLFIGSVRRNFNSLFELILVGTGTGRDLFILAKLVVVVHQVVMMHLVSVLGNSWAGNWIDYHRSFPTACACALIIDNQLLPNHRTRGAVRLLLLMVVQSNWVGRVAKHIGGPYDAPSDPNGRLTILGRPILMVLVHIFLLLDIPLNITSCRNDHLVFIAWFQIRVNLTGPPENIFVCLLCFDLRISAFTGCFVFFLNLLLALPLLLELLCHFV